MSVGLIRSLWAFPRHCRMLSRIEKGRRLPHLKRPVPLPCYTTQTSTIPNSYQRFSRRRNSAHDSMHKICNRSLIRQQRVGRPRVPCKRVKQGQSSREQQSTFLGRIAMKAFAVPPVVLSGIFRQPMLIVLKRERHSLVGSRRQELCRNTEAEQRSQRSMRASP